MGERCQANHEIEMDEKMLEDVKGVSLPWILADFGIVPADGKDPKSGRSYYVYLAAYRGETNPSLSVYFGKKGIWLWKDLASGEYGTSLDLLVKFGFFLTWREAAVYIAQKYLGATNERVDKPTPVHRAHTPVTSCHQASKTDYPGKILGLYPIQGSPAQKYITMIRRIPITIASQYLAYARYRYPNQDKEYFGMAWPTLKGGWSIRWAKDLGPHKGKTFVGQAGISYYPASAQMISDSCAVFEGMFDFLSFIALNNGIAPCDAIVLNSTSYANQAIEMLGEYGIINCYLDNDDAGRRATEVIRTTFGDAVEDHAAEYIEFNDLNDYLSKMNNTI